MARRTIPIIVALVLIASCGGGSGPDSSPTTPATAPDPVSAATTAPPVVPATTVTAPPITAAPPATAPPATSIPTTLPVSTVAPPTTAPPLVSPRLPVAALAWGLFCRDLKPEGYSYSEAVEYWVLEGKPNRMDADRNGKPCETVYPADEAAAFWADPPVWVIGPAHRWRVSEYEPAATPACCDANHTGPASPPLPPKSGMFVDDGAYDVSAARAADAPGRIVLTIRRWTRCSDAPQLCTQPYGEIDIGSDPSAAVERVVGLDSGLRVVVNAIPFDDGTSWQRHAIEGNGFSLAMLLHRLQAAYVHVIEPMYEMDPDPWTTESDLIERGVDVPLFPFGPADEATILGYRGPAEALLTTWAFHELLSGGTDGSGIWGWWSTLEVIDGTPILYLDAGQIAG